jgi:hypothetical protein
MILYGRETWSVTLREEPRLRWVDNIKMDVREMCWGGIDWIYLPQDQWRALVNTVMKRWVP